MSDVHALACVRFRELAMHSLHCALIPECVQSVVHVVLHTFHTLQGPFRSMFGGGLEQPVRMLS